MARGRQGLGDVLHTRTRGTWSCRKSRCSKVARWQASMQRAERRAVALAAVTGLCTVAYSLIDARSVDLTGALGYLSVVMVLSSVGVLVIRRPEVTRLRVAATESVVVGLGARGPRERLADVEQHFREEGIALEQMDTANAVHTFNILNDEGRTVGGAFLTLEPRGVDEYADPLADKVT